jgi:uncharacterized protein
MPRPVALITGPTSGIGAGYARRYASDGYDVVLVARDVDRLTQLAAELDGEAGSIEILPADLADPAGRAKVADRLVAGVQVLVNNAGFGTLGEFWTTDPKSSISPALPGCCRAGGYPAYSASKSGVVAFTEGLAAALNGTGVGAHAVCPGLVRTEFHRRAGIDLSSVPSFQWLEVDDVIRKSLADVHRGKVISIPGVWNKVLVATGRMEPRNLKRRAGNVIGRGRGRT